MQIYSCSKSVANLVPLAKHTCKGHSIFTYAQLQYFFIFLTFDRLLNFQSVIITFLLHLLWPSWTVKCNKVKFIVSAHMEGKVKAQKL